MTATTSRLCRLALLFAFALVSITEADAQQSYGSYGRSTRSSSVNRRSTSGYSAGGGQRDYNNNTMLGDATITSDPETRRIIVVTDEETSQHISQVISNLDRPQPQVLIKVVFLEVTHKNGLDVGIEGTYRKSLGTSQSLRTGATNNFGLLTDGFNPAPPGAGIYQIMGNDFQATLRAIATAGKTEILSRPSILARNSQMATITVGQEIPFITATRVSDLGTQNNTYIYQDIGIILRVTPFITQEGLVQMIVAPEISSLTDQNIAISPGVKMPVIAKRSADTVVVTPDGETVVIGGLMENNRTANDSKIPFLGDIPLLGNLFKRQTRGDQKTELIIFLTPHVVKAPTLLASMSNADNDKAELARKTFQEQELNKFFDKLPLKKPVTPDQHKATKKAAPDLPAGSPKAP